MQAPLDRHLMLKANDCWNVSIKTSKMNSNENDRVFSYLKIAVISLKPTDQPTNHFSCLHFQEKFFLTQEYLISPKVTGELFLIKKVLKACSTYAMQFHVKFSIRQFICLFFKLQGILCTTDCLHIFLRS